MYTLCPYTTLFRSRPLLGLLRLCTEQHQLVAVLLGMQIALAADPGEVAGGARATAHQLTVRILQELGVADGMMTQVLLAAALGAAGLQDQYLRGEQRLHGIQDRKSTRLNSSH